METFAPAVLKRKPAVELWQMRKRVVSELEANADSYEGRDPSTAEKDLEECGQKNLKAIDSVIEENFALNLG